MYHQFDISYIARRRVNTNEVATRARQHVCLSNIIDMVCTRRCFFYMVFIPIKDFIHMATNPAPSSHITMGQNFLLLIV